MSGPSWKLALRDELEKLPDDFVAFCRDVGAKATDAWEHADSDELRGLEAWGKELATRERALGVAALCAIAQTGFPRAMQAAGDAAANLGFHASEPSADGAPVETQIARAAAWLADPSEERHDQVTAGFDPSRQLHVWEEDLLPGTVEAPWQWYLEVGQCLAAAISRDGGDEQGSSYYEWPPAVSVARGMVMAARGLRGAGGDAATLELLRTGMLA